MSKTEIGKKAPAFTLDGTSGRWRLADTVASHEKFKQKMGFPFDLLSDPDQAVCKLYEVIQEKSMYGRKYMGVERSTFVVDAKGVMRHAWRKVKVNGHAEAVLEEVKSL